jgi:hypothetical protein
MGVRGYPWKMPRTSHHHGKQGAGGYTATPGRYSISDRMEGSFPAGIIRKSIRKEKREAYYEGNDVITNAIQSVVRYIFWKKENIFSLGIPTKVAGCRNVYIASNHAKEEVGWRSTCIICHPFIRWGMW